MNREVVFSTAGGAARRWVLGDVDILRLLRSIQELTVERDSVVTLAAADDDEIRIGIGDALLRISGSGVMTAAPGPAADQGDARDGRGNEVPRMATEARVDVMALLRDGRPITR